MRPDFDSAVEIFHRAMDYVREADLFEEIKWQRNVSFSEFDESQLLRESAWVILCSGFRETVVRRHFDYISLAFCDWESAEAIVDSYPSCKISALAAFKNEAKIQAIVGVAQRIKEVGFSLLRTLIIANPIEELSRMPYVGNITVWHLAKNLGMDVAKHDRHLARVSMKLGFGDAHKLCESLAGMVGEQARVIDLAIWRYLADNASYRKHWC